MKGNIFAIYKGKEYQAGACVDGSFVLISDDERDIINGFIRNTGFNKRVECYKYVLKPEIDEIYEKIVKAEYLGYEFLVIDETENMLLICTMTGDYRVWLRLGMESVDKGVYQKWVEKKYLEVKIYKQII